MSSSRLPHAMRAAVFLCCALSPGLANAQVSRQIEVRLDAAAMQTSASAWLLKAALDGLGANAEVRFFPGKTHMDLYAEGDDKRALLKQIAWQM